MQQGEAELGRRPFTMVVADEAIRAGGSAFDEAARVAERIPLAALHAVYLLKHGTSLTQLEDVAKSLRSDTTGRAAALGIHDRLMGVHVRAGNPVDAIGNVARELAADLVVVGETERRIGGLLKRSVVEKLRLELDCPVVFAASLGEPLPEIEPACPGCALARAQTAGRIWWCDAHRKPRPHLHRPRPITWPL